MISFILMSAVYSMTSFGFAQPETGIDPKDVVRQVQAKYSGQPSSRQSAFDNGEFLVDTNSALVPTPGSQTDAVIAFDGTNFLVVWQDQRGGNFSDICAARVTPQGTVLDPAGLVISQAAYDQQCPALAFDGSNFLVVWQDYRRGHSFDIYGSRVTPQGTVLDAFGIIVSEENNDQRSPAIAFDGASFLIVWEDDRAGSDSTDVYGARVSPAGRVLDTAGIAIAHAVRGQYEPALAFDGANFLAAWRDCRSNPAEPDIYGSRVTREGTALDPAGLVISQAMGSQASPAVSFDGTNFLVAWQDVHGSFPPVVSIYGTRVTTGGAVLDPWGIAISQGAGGRGLPAISTGGSGFVVVWQDGRGGFDSDIYGTRVTSGGTVLDTAGIIISLSADLQYSPAVGFDGANFLVAWQDHRNNPGEPDVYGTRLTPGGAVVDTGGLLMSQSARDQFAPAVAFDGTNFLVVWEDDRAGYTDIYGARMTPEGTVLDAAGFVISQTATWQFDPVLAFDGTNYLVAWQDYRNGSENPDIYGSRVTPSGTVLDPDGIAVTRAPSRQYYPAIGFDGSNFLVLWQDYRSSSYDIYGTLVTPGGEVLNTDGIAISQASNWQCRPVLCFDGANFLAVWEDYRNDPGYPDIYGARVSPGGNVLDGSGIAISRAQSGQYSPALDADGANSLVVWEDGRTSAWPDIYGARVTTAGAVLDSAGIAISRASKDQFAPAIAFDGATYLVVYEDYRGSNNPDIYGARVSPAGLVSEEGAVLRPPGTQTCLALARGSGNLLFLAYQGWAGVVNGKTYNADRIWGKMNPTPGGGIEEVAFGDWRLPNRATIVRRVLVFEPADSDGPKALGELIDISGRKLLNLRPGANDLRALAPGVYFIRDVRVQVRSQSVTKVVVAR